MIKYIYWPAAVLLMALGQGLLLPAIKRTPPGPEAKRQSFALHYVLTAAYFLPLVLAPGTWLEAVLSRLLLFDPVINLASGGKVFAVGATAATDRALRWLAARLSWPPERLRLVVWVVSLAISCWLLVISYK
ncbi:hypothetical protein [Hymenobacter sp. BT559]|uniref:hypothetical protein n=1 Tax=Hymenobacter sp. BT559 TaxID=2795729 RepID=UPI0018EBA0B6|nr:hypothetical protein [Hymenobacter sp. BT559]MBJ6145755.1 hypothetical protein [Hymenobacter sp. BT559]